MDNCLRDSVAAEPRNAPESAAVLTTGDCRQGNAPRHPYGLTREPSRGEMDSTTNSNSQSTTQSPCINVCAIDLSQTCQGCRRTLDEIAGWSSMTDTEKRLTNQRCENRRSQGPEKP